MALYKVKEGFSAKHRGVIYTSGAALDLTPEEVEILAVQVEFVQPLDPEPEPRPEPVKSRSKPNAERES